jgi:hypothetical protein
MRGRDAITALKRKLRVKTDESLQQRIGVKVPTIQLWKTRSKVTPRQFAELVDRASRAGATNFEASALRPLVEFFRVSKTKSKQGAKYELFNAPLFRGKKHPYLDGLRRELKAHHGVYVFFDSRGQVIYAGKARRQNLWNEMTNAFNRKRGDIQKIRRVKHPLRRQRYRTSQEKMRQIKEYAVPLHELATYFSAYQVADPMIPRVEALLVRSVANDLLNKRMETFGWTKKKK